MSEARSNREKARRPRDVAVGLVALLGILVLVTVYIALDRVKRAWPFGADEAKRRQLTAASAHGVKPVQHIDLGGGVKLTMVLIPPGRFQMGSPPGEADRGIGERLHWVTITKPFWLGKYEITQGQWQAVMGSNPSHFTGDDQLPVEDVSWRDCQRFLRTLNARVGGPRVALPTEAQWEYACRAGTSTPFHCGDTLVPGRDANYAASWRSKYDARTVPVGSFPANAWGLHDMHGNVGECCQDWWGEYPAGTQRDPTGPTVSDGLWLGGRVQRGAWSSMPASFCRSARRGAVGADDLGFGLGLRVARPLR